jgi:hypothetical protein
MAGFTPFTDNYNDLSDEHGYQFEFRCAICGSGYRSEFQRSAIGTASSLLGGASNLIGALWGASSATNTVKNITDRGARARQADQEPRHIVTAALVGLHWGTGHCRQAAPYARAAR